MTFLRIILAAVPLIFLSCSGASSKPWETLPDGRVVIEILHERLAFDPQDVNLVSFQRNDEGKHHTLTLADAIADPDGARVFFVGPRMPQLGIWVNLNISKERAVNPERPFLGKYDWEDLPRTSPTVPLRFSILPDNKPLTFGKDPIAGVMRWIRPHERPPSPPYIYFTKALGPSEFGFTSYPFEDPLPEQKHNGAQSIYVLPGSQRLKSSEAVLQVTCEVSGSPWRYCHFTQFSEDELVRIFLRWGENKFPEGSWKQLDRLIQDISAQIFIDRTGGDFE